MNANTSKARNVVATIGNQKNLSWNEFKAGLACKSWSKFSTTRFSLTRFRPGIDERTPLELFNLSHLSRGRRPWKLGNWPDETIVSHEPREWRKQPWFKVPLTWLTNSLSKVSIKLGSVLSKEENTFFLAILVHQHLVRDRKQSKKEIKLSRKNCIILNFYS